MVTPGRLVASLPRGEEQKHAGDRGVRDEKTSGDWFSGNTSCGRSLLSLCVRKNTPGSEGRIS